MSLGGVRWNGFRIGAAQPFRCCAQAASHWRSGQRSAQPLSTARRSLGDVEGTRPAAHAPMCRVPPRTGTAIVGGGTVSDEGHGGVDGFKGTWPDAKLVTHERHMRSGYRRAQWLLRMDLRRIFPHGGRRPTISLDLRAITIEIAAAADSHLRALNSTIDCDTIIPIPSNE